MHITSSVFVNDHEPGLWRDILQWVEKLAFRTHGKLDVGPWERIRYGEFDVRRRKRIVMKVMGMAANI